MPYHDSTASAEVTAANLTFAHTIGTGGKRLLVVALSSGIIGTDADDVTGVTYNGVAMTLVGKVSTAIDRYLEFWRLINPASGSHNVVVTASSSHLLSAVAADWSEIESAAEDDTDSATATFTSVTATVNTSVNNCICIAVAYKNFDSNDLNAGAGTLKRGESALQNLAILETDIPVLAGSDSLVATSTLSMMAIFAASYRPAPEYDFDFPVESQLSINPGILVASQLSIVSAIIAAPTFAYGCHLSQGSVLFTWQHSEPERLHHFNLYLATSLGGPYSLIGRSTAPRALIRNLPLGANLYFRVEAVGHNRTVSSSVQGFQGLLQNPIVPMSIQGIEGSVIPVGSVFSCVDTKTGSILSVQATERIEL